MEVIVAIVGGVFLTVNTWMNRKTSKRLKTGNGMDIGQLAESTYYKVESLNYKLDDHINDQDAHE